MNIFGLIVVIGIIGAVVLYLTQPWRTVYNFCSTYETGKQQLIQKWSQEENYGGSNDDFSKLINSAVTVAGEPTDLANFFGNLDNVAPEDIEPDIATLKNAFQNESNQMSSAAGGNLLGALGASFIASLQSAGAMERVNAYIQTNCDSKAYLQGGGN